MLWSLCTLYLLACLERDTVGDSGLWCCVCVWRLSNTNELPCLLTLVDIGWLLVFLLLFFFLERCKMSSKRFFFLFFSSSSSFFLKRCKMSSKVHSREINTIGDKNDYNWTRKHLFRDQYANQSFLLFYPWFQKAFWWRHAKAREKSAERGSKITNKC